MFSLFLFLFFSCSTALWLLFPWCLWVSDIRCCSNVTAKSVYPSNASRPAQSSCQPPSWAVCWCGAPGTGIPYWPERRQGTTQISWNWLLQISTSPGDCNVSVFAPKVRQYPMGEYDSQMDDKEKSVAAPIHHRVNLEGYLRSYLYSPAFYLLSAARARLLLEAHCGIEQPQQEARARKRDATEKEATGNTRHGQTNTQKVNTHTKKHNTA